MNEAIAKFIKHVEQSARKTGRKRYKMNEIEIMFLENVFGPEFNYDFEGLTPQFYFKDYKDGSRYVDFIFNKGYIKIIIEIDGRKWHVTGITQEQFDDHQERQNDLLLSGGFLLLRFTANMVKNKPMLCRRQLMQAVGRCYITSTAVIPTSTDDLWTLRRSKIQILADQTPGHIKPADVAAACSVTRRTAVYWLQKLTDEGCLHPVKKDKRVIGYRWLH